MCMCVVSVEMEERRDYNSWRVLYGDDETFFMKEKNHGIYQT